MNRLPLLLISLIVPAIPLLGKIVLSEAPCALIYTPNTILLNPPANAIKWYAGDRPRYSTCSGVDWFPGTPYLYSVDLEASEIQVFEFTKATETLKHLKVFLPKDKTQLQQPENLAFSKDGKYLAIPNNSGGKVTVYRTDPEKFLKTPKPLAVLNCPMSHGTVFSHDHQYLAHVGLGTSAGIHVRRIIEDGDRAEFKLLQSIKTPFRPLTPKSIAFSNDDRFVVIGYCVQLRSWATESIGKIATYRFDSVLGQIDPNPISIIDGLKSVETVAFCKDNSAVFATDQNSDKITAHAFDKDTGQLGESWIALENPGAQLNLPHGISFSPEGDYVAVANYGDDKVTIYRVTDTQ